MDIKRICFERINDDFSYGMYGEFKVIMYKNGYFNVTELCNKVNREFRKWNTTNKTDELLQAAEEESGIKKENLTMVISNQKNKLRGTYAHHSLVPHIASWASPTFAMKVSRIVNEQFVKEATYKYTKRIQEKDNMIYELKDNMNELLKDSKSSKKKINNLLRKNDKLLDEAKSAKRKLNTILKQNERLSDKLDESNDKKVVPTGKKGDINKLLIVKNNSDNKRDYKYTAFRVQNKNLKMSLKSHLDKFPEMKVILNISESPNAINLWMRVKNSLQEKFSKIKGRNFNLINGYSSNKFKRDIIKIHDERFINDDSDESDIESESDIDSENDSDNISDSDIDYN